MPLLAYYHDHREEIGRRLTEEEAFAADQRARDPDAVMDGLRRRAPDDEEEAMGSAADPAS